MIKAETFFANRYLLKKLIGAGGYSQVWLAEDTKAGNMPVAVKIFAPEKGLDDKGLEIFSKEYALVFNLKHPGLLRPSHFDDFEGSPYLVMPYCSNGSVFNKVGEINEKDLAVFMKQAASALAYLHKQNPPIIHQDIKPDNFLIDDEGNYLLADFGISSRIRRTLTKSMGDKTSAGTLAYMPPEKFSREKLIIKEGDIFSLGATLFELITGDLPFGDHGGLILFKGSEIPDLPSNFSSELNQLIRECMALNPSDRPTSEQLVSIADQFIQTGAWKNTKDQIQKPETSINKSKRETLPVGEKQDVKKSGDKPKSKSPVINNNNTAETIALKSKENSNIFDKKTEIINSSSGEQATYSDTNKPLKETQKNKKKNKIVLWAVTGGLFVTILIALIIFYSGNNSNDADDVSVDFKTKAGVLSKVKDFYRSIDLGKEQYVSYFADSGDKFYSLSAWTKNDIGIEYERFITEFQNYKAVINDKAFETEFNENETIASYPIQMICYRKSKSQYEWAYSNITVKFDAEEKITSIDEEIIQYQMSEKPPHFIDF